MRVQGSTRVKTSLVHVHLQHAPFSFPASLPPRYWPVQNDTVVGVITQRFPDSYAVDINAAFPAALGALAFEGATRRSRPQLKVGDVVCCRVEVAARDLDPVLTCMDAAGRAAGFGPLKNGHLVRVGTLFAKALAAGPPFLRTLGTELKFELAVGANGMVWVDAESPADAVAVGLAVRGGEGATREEAQKLTKALLAARRTSKKVGS